MLAASNEIHLREVYSTLAVYGGLLGRTLFVKSDCRRKPNPMFGDEIKEAIFSGHHRQILINSLQTLSKLRGEAVVSPMAKEEYHTWYKDLYGKYGIRPDKSGIIARIHTTVAKVSLILAVAETYELEIKQHHVQEAISMCIALLPNYEIFVMTTGSADIATAGSYLLNELCSNGTNGISKKYYLRKFWTEVDEEIFDKMTRTLETVGLIKVDIHEKELKYFLTEQGKDKLGGKK